MATKILITKIYDCKYKFPNGMCQKLNIFNALKSGKTIAWINENYIISGKQVWNYLYIFKWWMSQRKGLVMKEEIGNRILMVET